MQRRRPTAILSVNTPFDKEKFNFCKVNQSEVLLQLIRKQTDPTTNQAESSSKPDDSEQVSVLICANVKDTYSMYTRSPKTVFFFNFVQCFYYYTMYKKSKFTCFNFDSTLSHLWTIVQKKNDVQIIYTSYVLTMSLRHVQCMI